MGRIGGGRLRRESIRTPDQRLRVFISSTLGELAAERNAVGEVVRRLRLAPVMFELAARAHPPRQLYRSYLEQSDVFVGIYWERYGWIAPDMDISGLEDEYRLSGDMPRLLYVKEPGPGRDQRLDRLVGDMAAGATPPRVFNTPGELAELVANDLALLLSSRFSGDASPTAATDEPVETHDRAPLPVPPTPLVHRESEVAATRDLLLRDDVRLVTLTGPGGIGKSRVAIEVATQVSGVFDRNVWFVPLAAVVDPDLVVATIASGLGIPGEGTRSHLDRIVGYLHDQRGLLVLDNFEHVLPAATVVSDIVARCPHLRVLVTSRAVLRLHGEWEQSVPPLTSAEGAELFEDRVRDVRHDRPLSDDERHIATQISARLDGLPLAIELAAARARMLPPAALLKRLRHGLDVLSSGPADLPARQQTLRATIEWSYLLLPPAERDLLQRLAVFAGGWTLEAAEEVCGDDADVLTGLSVLLEHSLIQLDSRGDDPRFVLLETIREYALERLEESGDAYAAHDRHAAWIEQLASQAQLELRGRGVAAWTARLDTETDNVRAAVRWLSRERQDRRLVRLTWRTLLYLWTADHLVEVGRWLRPVHDDPGALPPRDRPKLELLWGVVTYEAGDYTTARMCLQEAYDGFVALGDAVNAPAAQLLLGIVHPHFGLDEDAAHHLQQAVAGLRAVGDQWGLAFALNMLAVLVTRHGDLEAAAAHAGEAFSISRHLRNRVLAAQALVQLGHVSLLRGNRKRARGVLHDAVDVFRTLRHREGFANCLDALAALALADDDPRRAAMLLGGSDALRAAIGANVWPLLQAERDAITVATRRRLAGSGSAEPAHAFATAYAAGHAMSHDDLLQVALRPTAVAVPT